MKKQKLFPVSLSLEGKTCLVIGGGKIAEMRVKALLDCGARVRLVSPEATPALAKLARRGLIFWVKDLFREKYLGSSTVVFGATSDQEANHWVYKVAKEKYCLVNLADDPPHCDFHVPSVVRRGHLAVAVSTDGQAPAFSAWLAKVLDRLLDGSLGQVVARYARQRPKLKARYPEMQARAQAWRQIIEKESPKVWAIGRGSQ